MASTVFLPLSFATPGPVLKILFTACSWYCTCGYHLPESNGFTAGSKGDLPFIKSSPNGTKAGSVVGAPCMVDVFKANIVLVSMLFKICCCF